MQPIQITGLINQMADPGLAKSEALASAGTTDFSKTIASKLAAPASMETIFTEASSAYGIPTAVIKAVAKAESDFNPKARSHCGAQGVMQLMPATARGLGVTDPWDVRQNIMGGTKYLRSMLDKYNGNLKLALAAYNAGSNNVDKYGGVPPFKETQNYVTKIMGMLKEAGVSETPALSPVTTSPIAGSGSTASSLQNAFFGGSSQSLLSQIKDFDRFSEDDYILLLELMRLSMSSSLSQVFTGNVGAVPSQTLGGIGLAGLLGEAAKLENT